MNDPEIHKKRQQTCLERYGTIFPFANTGPNSVSYWEKQGYSQDDAVKKVSEHQSIVSNQRKTTVSCWRNDYWISKGFTEEEAIAKVSEYQQANSRKGNNQNTSQSSIKFLNRLEKEIGETIEREILLLDKFTVDGFIPKYNIVIEFFGSFWHMHPSLFEATDLHPRTRRKAQSQWNEDGGRIHLLKTKGFHVFVMWDIDEAQTFSSLLQEIKAICKTK